MTEFMTEQLVKQRQTTATVVKKGALIAVTALFLLLSMVISLFMIAFMIMLVVDYFVFPRFNLEFEYTYFTGSLDIDKIMNMQARKRVISTDVKDIDIVAPTGSPELRPYQELKVIHCGTKEPENKTYELVAPYKDGKVRIIFEPNEEILKGMKMLAPRKVIL